MALTIFNGMSPPRRSVTTRTRIASALHTAETKAHRDDARRAPPDAAFLAQLARRFAADTRLPIELARRRVQEMAISARPKPTCGFQDRGQ